MWNGKVDLEINPFFKFPVFQKIPEFQEMGNIPNELIINITNENYKIISQNQIPTIRFENQGIL